MLAEACRGRRRLRGRPDLHPQGRRGPLGPGADHRWHRVHHRRRQPEDLGRRRLKRPLPRYLRGIVELPGGIIYPVFRIYLTAIGLFTAIALWFVYKRTYIGAAIRAGVDDREMVSATGIHIDRLFLLISALASFLAGLSGVLGGAFLTVYPGAEWEILVFALVVVIVGGLGSLEGAMIGAMIVGLLDAYGRWLAPELSYFVLFGPMAVLLLFRPRGLFGTANMT